LSKKKKPPFYSLQVNQPPQPNFIPSAVSQQILGPAGQQGLVAVETSLTLSGPLPAPDVIGGYEKVLPGSADRIIRMAEKEQDHRHALQGRSQTHLVRLTFVGQLFAFVLGISGILGGIYLVKNDKSIVGFSVFFTSLAALVGLFLFNQSRQSKPAVKNNANKS
jgi:uncharacterized membrane protein